MRILGNYALVYILRGSGGYIDSNGGAARLGAGDLLLIFPDIPHWYGPPEGTVWDEFYTVFSGPVFDLWRAKGLLDPGHPVRHLEPVDYWLRHFQEAALAETNPLQQVCALQRVLAEALQAGEEASESRWLAQARGLLEMRGRDPESAAAEMAMSYETFRKRFRAAAGVPPGYYRMAKVIDKACALMMAGGLTNKEIAERLRFCDEFHFSRRFKQVTGLTPTQFRQKTPNRSDPAR